MVRAIADGGEPRLKPFLEYFGICCGQRVLGRHMPLRPKSRPVFRLSHKPEPDCSEMVIERVCKPNSRALHDREARRVDGRQFVQIRVTKVFPRLLQIAQLAGKDFYGAGLIDRFSPRQRHVPVGVAVEKCECLDDNGNGGVKLRACSMQ